MNRLQKVALIAQLADRLQSLGSWCGETHLQKSVYALQQLFSLPTGFEFILYKHGPFSFDLRDELTAMRADDLLELRSQPAPYGPSLVPTAVSSQFRSRFPVTLAKYTNQLRFVADKFGKKGVAELERLATALYVTREQAEVLSTKERAERIHELKPHVSPEQALVAVAEMDEIIQEAAELC